MDRTIDHDPPAESRHLRIVGEDEDSSIYMPQSPTVEEIQAQMGKGLELFVTQPKTEGTKVVKAKPKTDVRKIGSHPTRVLKLVSQTIGRKNHLHAVGTDEGTDLPQIPSVEQIRAAMKEGLKLVVTPSKTEGTRILTAVKAKKTKTDRRRPGSPMRCKPDVTVIKNPQSIDLIATTMRAQGINLLNDYVDGVLIKPISKEDLGKGLSELIATKNIGYTQVVQKLLLWLPAHILREKTKHIGSLVQLLIDGDYNKVEGVLDMMKTDLTMMTTGSSPR